MVRVHIAIPPSTAVAALLVAAGIAVAQPPSSAAGAWQLLALRDAALTPRHVFAVQVAPLRLEREASGVYNWEAHPRLSYGLTARTEVALSGPVRHYERGAAYHQERNAQLEPSLEEQTALAGLHLSALHLVRPGGKNRASIALAGTVIAPVGGLGPSRPMLAVRVIATKEYSFGRASFNAEGMVVDESANGSANSPLSVPRAARLSKFSQWMYGVAVERRADDRTALTAGLSASDPMIDSRGTEWSLSAGVRRWASRRLAVDATASGLVARGRGILGLHEGRSFAPGPWSVTVGALALIGQLP